MSIASQLACVEVGGSSTQTVLFDDTGAYEIVDGAHQPLGARLALAVPGFVDERRVIIASNLDWIDVDPVEALDLFGPAELLINDGEAAALGEAALRERSSDRRSVDLVYVSLGTGIGGAVVLDGALRAGNLFGHTTGFGDRLCACGQRGCLETVAAGWALPDSLHENDVATLVESVARAIDGEPLAHPELVVVGGGLTRRYQSIVPALAGVLPARTLEPSAAPAGAKSAAPWGLRRRLRRTHDAIIEQGASR